MERECLIEEYERILKVFDDNMTRMGEGTLRIAMSAGKLIPGMQERILYFDNNREAWIQERQNELMAPIRLKISAAIQLVGQQKNYLYVIDTSKTKTIVTPPEHDLTAAVKMHLQH
jgi:hypothetical protein